MTGDWRKVLVGVLAAAMEPVARRRDDSSLDLRSLTCGDAEACERLGLLGGK